MKFLIKKDKHYSEQYLYKFVNILNTNRFLKYQVLFDNTCKYEIPKEDQEDINKLFGYTLGFNHHKDSARFGWFYQDKTIHLHAYVYDNGVRKSKLIKNLDLNTQYVLTLVDEGNNWLFSVDDGWSVIGSVKIPKSCEFKYGYKLWPYFGGNNTAPHDITIQMNCWY